MANKWEILTIADIAEKIAMGPFGSNIKVETFVPNGVPIISGAHLKGLQVTEKDFNFITEEHAQKLKNSIVYPGDIIFTHAGNVGQVAMIPYDCKYPYYMISQRQFFMRCNKKRVLPEFIVLFFHSRDGQGKLLANVSQVGVPSIAQPSTYLKRIELSVPAIDIQKEIIRFIFGIERKIELNTRIIANLEAQAQAIFKSWFVDFEPFQDGEFEESELGLIPKGWRVGTLGEIAHITSGKRPVDKSDEKTETFIFPIIGASQIMGYTTQELYSSKIIVTGRVGTHGIIQRFSEPCWPSDNTLVITSDYYEFVFNCLRGIDYKSLNRGSTQPLITQTDIKNTHVLVPTNKTLHEFENSVSTLMLLVRHCVEEIDILRQTRDTLLPKLMSGEIEVRVNC